VKKHTTLIAFPILFLLALVNIVSAADESPADKFLGSPLLILAVALIIAAIAFVYHKIRK
jgi:uncharacterized membrane protein